MSKSIEVTRRVVHAVHLAIKQLMEDLRIVHYGLHDVLNPDAGTASRRFSNDQFADDCIALYHRPYWLNKLTAVEELTNVFALANTKRCGKPVSCLGIASSYHNLAMDVYTTGPVLIEHVFNIELDDERSVIVNKITGAIQQRSARLVNWCSFTGGIFREGAMIANLEAEGAIAESLASEVTIDDAFLQSVDLGKLAAKPGSFAVKSSSSVAIHPGELFTRDNLPAAFRESEKTNGQPLVLPYLEKSTNWMLDSSKLQNAIRAGCAIVPVKIDGKRKNAFSYQGLLRYCKMRSLREDERENEGH